MNRFLNFANRLEPQDNLLKSVAPKNENVDVLNKDSQLLDYIYAIDPQSCMPSGDLAIYLGDKANPEIRQFIELNLLNENPNTDSPMSLPDEVVNKMKGVIKDDDIAFFTRNHNETREEYADRLKLYFLKEKEVRRREGKLKEIEGLLKKKDLIKKDE